MVTLFCKLTRSLPAWHARLNAVCSQRIFRDDSPNLAIRAFQPLLPWRGIRQPAVHRDARTGRRRLAGGKKQDRVGDVLGGDPGFQ
jgi:hypothetical protein